MKRKIILTALALTTAALMLSCAKKSTGVSTNESVKRYLDAWIDLQKQTQSGYLWEKTPLGSYILEKSGGDGIPTGDSDNVPFARVHLTMFDLSGNVVSSSTEFWAKRLGYYNQGNSYDPIVVRRGSGSMAPGIDEIISMMSSGQKVKLLIPGWLVADDNNYPRYASADEYYKNCTGTSSIIEIELAEGIKDLEAFQLKQITSFLSNKYGKTLSPGDSSGMHGFYYVQLKAPSDTSDLNSTSSGTVNYTGMLTTSRVFDTTIEDIAKENHIYNANSEYSPVSITWAENYKDITMGESSTPITGFQFALHKMRKGEKGVAVFTSDLGYGSVSPSGRIPQYSPLAFELEVVNVN